MKYTVAIDCFAGSIFVDFRRYADGETVPNLCYSAEIEPQQYQDKLYLNESCICRFTQDIRESAPQIEVEISLYQFTYYLRSLLYAVETGKGKAYANNLLAVACISVFLFAQFTINVKKASSFISDQLKSLQIFNPFL